MDGLAVPASDGYPLPATLFEPEGTPRAAVIVSPATATPRGFYRAFSTELAKHGAVVVTYDYRGTFEPPRELKHSHARMRDWGELDFAGVVEWTHARYPDLPLYAVGHSVGGHVLLMTPQSAKVSRAVNVASQSGYWGLFQRGFERYRVYAFMKVVLPLLTRAFGYFPGKRVIFGTNLAPGVLYDWARWCVKPRYFFEDPEMTATLANARTFTAPTLMIGIADDPWATPAAIEAIRAGFIAAPTEHIELEPRDYGMKSVGHMGFFRAANAALWPRVTDALGLT